MGLQLGHVPGQERAIRPDGVARQGCFAGGRHELPDVVEDHLSGLCHCGSVGQGIQEPRVGVHLADKIAHPSQLLFTRLDQHVDALAQHIQVLVRDEYRDFYQCVVLQIEPGHLAVDPHQFITHRPSLLPTYGSAHSMIRPTCVESPVRRSRSGLSGPQ